MSDAGPAIRVVTREEMRALDRWAIGTVGIPSAVLMENAGRGVAGIVRERLGTPGGPERGPVLILCGPGNNGGDGFVAARHLVNAGAAVRLALAGREEEFDRPGDAGIFHRVARAMGIEARAVSSGADLAAMARGAACVVDALFGTGLTRPVTGLHRDLIEALNAAGPEIVAVDIPSGLDADEGRPLGAAVRASVTATMAFPKAGFFRAEGPAFCGAIRVVDIGIPRDVPRWDGKQLVS